MSPIEDKSLLTEGTQQIVEMAEKIAEGWYEVGDRITSRSTVLIITFHVTRDC